MPKSPKSLLEELQEFMPKKGPGCGIGVTLAAMPPDDRAQFTAVLAMPHDHAPHMSVSRLMRSKGFDRVTPNAIARHRNGVCSCKR